MTPIHRRMFPGADALAEPCRRHGIRRLSLFGARPTGTERADGGVDLLIGGTQ